MLKRTWLSTIRKPSKTIILVLILFVMANLLLATLAIKNSVTVSTDAAKEKLGATVYLQPDTESLFDRMQTSRESGETDGPLQFSLPTISESLATSIANSKYIKDFTYSLTATANASSYTVVQTAQNERERQFRDALDSTRDQMQGQIDDFNSARDRFNSSNSGGGGGMRIIGGGVPGGNFSFNFNLDTSDPTLARGDTQIEGINAFDFISDVESGNLTIIDGTAFDESTENGVVISTELAEANSLHVGDRLTFKTTTDDAAEISMTIVGIYKTSTEDFDYNTIYTNITSAKQFLSDQSPENLTVNNVRYYLTSASIKDDFLAETSTTHPDLATDGYKLDIDDSSYQTMVGPIEKVGSFATTIMWIVVIAAVVIITLIVVINVRERRYEMGVLLSLGAKRTNILGQIFIELVLVGTIGFALSLGTSQLLARQMGEGLLADQVEASQQSQEENDTPGSSRGTSATIGRMPIQIGGPSSTPQSADPIKDIDISAGPAEYLTLFGLGYLILLLAMIAPSINILRYQPKTILTGKE